MAFPAFSSIPFHRHFNCLIALFMKDLDKKSVPVAPELKIFETLPSERLDPVHVVKFDSEKKIADLVIQRREKDFQLPSDRKSVVEGNSVVLGGGRIN